MVATVPHQRYCALVTLGLCRSVCTDPDLPDQTGYRIELRVLPEAGVNHFPGSNSSPILVNPSMCKRRRRGVARTLKKRMERRNRNAGSWARNRVLCLVGGGGCHAERVGDERRELRCGRSSAGQASGPASYIIRGPPPARSRRVRTSLGLDVRLHRGGVGDQSHHCASAPDAAALGSGGGQLSGSRSAQTSMAGMRYGQVVPRSGRAAARRLIGGGQHRGRTPGGRAWTRLGTASRVIRTTTITRRMRSR